MESSKIKKFLKLINTKEDLKYEYTIKDSENYFKIEDKDYEEIKLEKIKNEDGIEYEIYFLKLSSTMYKYNGMLAFITSENFSLCLNYDIGLDIYSILYDKLRFDHVFSKYEHLLKQLRKNKMKNIILECENFIEEYNKMKLKRLIEVYDYEHEKNFLKRIKDLI